MVRKQSQREPHGGAPEAGNDERFPPSRKAGSHRRAQQDGRSEKSRHSHEEEGLLERLRDQKDLRRALKKRLHLLRRRERRLPWQSNPELVPRRRDPEEIASTGRKSTQRQAPSKREPPAFPATRKSPMQRERPPRFHRPRAE